MSLLIKGARVVDPGQKLDKVCDLFVENGKVTKLGVNLKVNARTVVEAEGKLLFPGLIDMHVHLREPGREDKETFCSGTLAAAKGGITGVLAMPNTDPVPDSIQNLKFIKERLEKSRLSADVFLCASITKQRQGKELTDIEALTGGGALAFSDDGSSVDDEALMKQALLAGAKTGRVIICHCEDASLSMSGQINLGFMSTKLGLRGYSKQAEFKRVARDIELARELKTSVHIAHVSCKESVEIIAKARKEKVKVTAETAPHYISFSELALQGYDTNCKINPPLRTEDDVDALRKALAEGIIDALASDHAPHTQQEKQVEFELASFGTTGLETLLAAAITYLVKPGIIDYSKLVEVCSLQPAKILGIDKGTLLPGKDADFILVDVQSQEFVREDSFVSLAKNSCFLNRQLTGVVLSTYLRGKLVYQKQKAE